MAGEPTWQPRSFLVLSLPACVSDRVGAVAWWVPEKGEGSPRIEYLNSTK